MDKPNAFKNWINEQVVKSLSSEIFLFYPKFNAKEFCKISNELGPLELKARVLLITTQLRVYLPDDYKEALSIIVKVFKNDKLQGFSLWPFSEYIGQFGLNDFDDSLKAMYLMTQKFTSEFAVRPFFLKDHKKVLKYFLKWSTDKNEHVRRWTSEGSRPLLPWGMRLPLFVMDPTHTILLLEKLKYDEKIYVRKSVANHLNDIAKNHPQIVVEVLRSWENECPEKHKDKIHWIKKHALRVLIKKGYAPAMKLMGVSKPKIKLEKFKILKNKVKVNEKLIFDFIVRSTSSEPQKLIIDYKIHFMKANGTHGSKVFKLKTFQLGPKEILAISKSHSLKPITTMKYYNGIHHLGIQINGEVMVQTEFELKN
jgi:3-methyladenine DNA glycosylase AlkC